MVHRSGAKAGDRIMVTGTIGDAALGLAVLKGTLVPDAAARAALIERYRVPQPRNTLATVTPSLWVYMGGSERATGPACTLSSRAVKTTSAHPHRSKDAC